MKDGILCAGAKNRPAGVERALGEIGSRGEEPMSGYFSYCIFRPNFLSGYDKSLYYSQEPSIVYDSIGP